MRSFYVYPVMFALVLLVFSIGLCPPARAQDDPLVDLEARIEKLEQQLSLKQEFLKLSEQFAALSKELDDTVLSERLKNLEQQYTQALQELETVSLAQLEQKITRLEERLKSHEELAEVAKELREDTINKRFEIIEQKYAQAVQKYDQSIQALQIEQDEFKNEVTEANNTFKNDVAQKNMVIYAVWGVITLFGVGTLITTLVAIFHSSPKLIKKEMHQQIAEIFTTEQEYIGQMVQAQEMDSQIKATTRLLLLSDKKDEREKIQVQFQLMGFPHVQSRLFEDVFDSKQQVLKLDESQYDLVVFNQLSIEQINAYVDRSAFDAFAGYTFEYLDPKKLTHRERLNFGQSPFTLYARTMEVLRYQALLKK